MARSIFKTSKGLKYETIKPYISFVQSVNVQYLLCSG